MIWYWYSFLYGFKCILQLYSAEVLISYGYQYRVTLCICQLHLIPVYKTVFWVYAVLELSVIRCSFYYFLDRVVFHHTFHRYDYHCYWDFYGHYFHLNYTFRISVTKYFCFCKCLTPWMFPSPEILLEYWIGHVPLGLTYVMFIFPTRVSYRAVPGFECPCGAWYFGLTTCLMYVSLLFGNLV